ncbi:MAG: hypothetical protein A2068_03085 [Ignavibacteria bacterium GWB2_35_6b]|nr:MAG: hypothetical protein A2068_03085 [Ignavibacteria bacterium GWB2_35_6b]
MNHVTQLDIAKKLDVTRITVSKALRNHPDISTEMKKRVHETAEKLGYVPNLIAKNLTSQKTCTIGLVIPDLENSFFAYITDSVIDAASEREYNVLVTVSRESRENEIQNIQNLIGMRVDGMLVCLTQQSDDSKIFDHVKKIGIPLVFFDRQIEQLNLSSVVFDDRNGAFSALDKIIEEGYTKIAHFAGYQKINIGRERCLGYKDALSKYNIKINADWILEGGFEVIDGERSFMKLYNENNLPEVILAVNDRVALGIYHAARKVGINIPEDIGIVAFGFNEIAELFAPPLAIINQHPRQMGKLAMDLLYKEIEHKESSNTQHVHLKIEENFYWNNSLKKSDGK